MKIKLTGANYFQSKKTGATLVRICGFDTETPTNGVGVLTQNLVGDGNIKITQEMVNKIYAVCTNGNFVTELVEVK